MNPTTEKYLFGLKRAYLDKNAKDIWEHFEKIKHGSSKANIEKLTKAYSGTPDALISLLEYVDGTYWREYAGEKIAFYLLGSDVDEYPYYLLSSDEILQNHDQIINYSDCIERKYDTVEVDDKITSKADGLKWLHFSDCMNNGGTSQLFIDFSPSSEGKNGQIVRFLHDPDEFKVIAESFEDYLNYLINNNYDFVHEDM